MFNNFPYITKNCDLDNLTCEFCEICKNTFFTEHFWTAASKSLNFSIGITEIGLGQYNKGRNIPAKVPSKMQYFPSTKVPLFVVPIRHNL